METFLITAYHLRDGIYAANTDVANFDGHIIVGEGLGTVYFPGHLKASGGITAHTGSGIQAGGNIWAAWAISAGLGISSGGHISSYADIFAGAGLSARLGISACRDISAEWDILTGGGICTDESVLAGFAIDADWIDANDRIFAGICEWRVPAPKEMEIRAEIRFGEIISGIHVPPVKKETI